MFKPGKKAYFVESLLLPADPVKIINVSIYDNGTDRAMITARKRDGTIISDYSTKFTAKKPTTYKII